MLDRTNFVVLRQCAKHPLWLRNLLFGFLLTIAMLPFANLATADDELTRLLQVQSSNEGQAKRLQQGNIKERLAELKKELAELKKQKHQQKLGKEIEKLDKLIAKYQQPMKVEGKDHLKNDKTIKKLRGDVAIKAKSLRGLDFKLQTVHASIQQHLSLEVQALKRYQRATKEMKKLVTKQFPLERIYELESILEKVKKKLEKQKAEFKQSAVRLKKIDKEIAGNQKKLKALRKKMFKDPTAKNSKKDQEKGSDTGNDKPSDGAKNKAKPTSKPTLSKEQLKTKKEKSEVTQTISQLHSLIRRLQFSYLSQQYRLLNLRKKDEKLQQANANVELQILELTQDELKALYKFHSSKLEDGFLFYQPFDYSLTLFRQVGSKAQSVFQDGRGGANAFYQNTSKVLSARKTKMGDVKFFFYFLGLPLLLILLGFFLKSRLLGWSELSLSRFSDNQVTLQLKKYVRIVSQLGADLIHFATWFAALYLIFRTLGIHSQGWGSLILLVAGLLLGARFVISLGQVLFSPDNDNRVLQDLDEDVATKVRGFLRFIGLFSLVLWTLHHTLVLLKYPKQFTELFILIYVVVTLVWLWGSFLRLGLWSQLFNPPKVHPNTRLVVYRLFPLLLVIATLSFGVYASGYRNLGGYILYGLVSTIFVVVVTMAVFRLSTLVLFWFFSVEKKDLPVAPDESVDGEETPAAESEGVSEATRSTRFHVNVNARTAQIMRFALGAILFFTALGLLLEIWDVPKGWKGIPFVLKYPILTFQKSKLSVLSFVYFFLVFGSTLWFSGWLRDKLTKHVYPALGIQLGTQYAVNTILGYLFLFVGLLAALQVMGMGLGVLTVFAGALGIGIGFGMRDIASNFISGLILIFGRPISVGDVIVVGGNRGVVKSISARSTTIETAGSHIIMIPNANLITSPVENLSKGAPYISFVVDVGVAYGSDLELVKKTLLEIVNEHPKLAPGTEPGVNIAEFGDNNIVFRCVFKSDSYLFQGGVKAHVCNEVARRFNELGIQMAFPQTDLHLDPKVEDAIDAMKDFYTQQTQGSKKSDSSKKK